MGQKMQANVGKKIGNMASKGGANNWKSSRTKVEASYKRRKSS